MCHTIFFFFLSQLRNLQKMKFNKRLRRLLRVQWEEQYVNYKRLKQELKRCKAVASSGQAVHEFLLALDDELAKVNAFVELQRVTLSDQLDATVRSLHGGCLSADEHAHAQRLFAALQTELIALRSYTELNYVAVLKIVKKANKVLQPSPIIEAHALLLRQPFYTGTELSHLLTRVDIVASQLAALAHGTALPDASEQRNYTCAICLDLLAQPVVLPCSHRFCAACIAQHLDSAAAARDAANAANAATHAPHPAASHSRANSASADKPMLNTHQIFDLMRHQGPAASCPICRRAVNPLSVQVDTILERFIVRSFGQHSLDAEKSAPEPVGALLPPPALPAAVVPRFTEHPSRVGAYSIGDLLGRGRYAHVYIGQRSLSAVPHAIKVFKGVREAQHLNNAGLFEAVAGDKVAESLLTVQQQTVFRIAAEALRTAATELAVLRAIAPFACPFLPELIDVVYVAQSRSSSIANSTTTTTTTTTDAAQGTTTTAADMDEDKPSGVTDDNNTTDDDSGDDEQSSDVEDEDVSALPSNDARCWAIVLPLYSGGDLAGYVDSSRGVPERTARLLLRQLVSATATLHAAGFVHRDIKADNVLIRSLDAPLMPPGTPHLVLCDMGLAVQIGTRNLAPAGTLEYIPPEALTNSYVAAEAFDVWSLGILLFATVAHRFPFNTVDAIRQGSYSMSRRFSSPLARLMQQLLDPNPLTRITLAQLTNDPWFRA